MPERLRLPPGQIALHRPKTLFFINGGRGSFTEAASDLTDARELALTYFVQGDRIDHGLTLIGRSPKPIA